MRLIQIPFSHNCVKVRRALELKGLAFTTLDIAPMNRRPVLASSGQGRVPVLEDGERVIADSTAILRHLEATCPERPLLPGRPDLDAECWLLEDWADATFMKITRRMAYWTIVTTPGALESLFGADASPLKKRLIGILGRRALKRRFGISAEQHRRDARAIRPSVALALERLGDRPFLVGERVSVADVTLAAMLSPLWAVPEIREEPAVARLLAWTESILDPGIVEFYRNGPPVRAA